MATRLFVEADTVSIEQLLDICKDYSELLLFLWKSALLGDYSGNCESCGVGTINLNKCGDKYFWRCGARV